MNSSDQTPDHPKKAFRQAGLILKELNERGSIDKERFLELCGLNGFADTASTLGADWHRAANAIAATLQFIDRECSWDGRVLSSASLGIGSFTSNSFNVSADREGKDHIGELVADFLNDSEVCNLEESVLLGSGTTVFHIGMKMCGKGPYPQLFSTINVALASLWCSHANPPTKQVSIPSGVLETDTFRFETLREDRDEKRRWTPAVVIVGADGCHYDRATGRIWLYGKSESVANNTNLYIQSATTVVLYCLSSRKTNERNTNTGPKLDPPPDGVIPVLVTGVEPLRTEIRQAFEKQNYVIVEEKADFGKLKGRRERPRG